MDITLKSPSEIEKMRIAGAATARVLEMIEPYVVPADLRQLIFLESK